VIEKTRICREVRPRCSADRLLIDDDQSLDPVQASDDLAAFRLHRRVEPIVLFAGVDTLTQFFGDRLHQKLTNKARLSGS
jgi:hypothetical protein